MARHALHADGDHAPAALVLLQHLEHVLLVADGADPAAGAGSTAPARAQSPRHPRAGAVPHAAGRGAGLDPRTVPVRLGPGVQAHRRPAAADRAADAEALAPACHRHRAPLRGGAAERARRARRDLSGDGQQRDDVRGTRRAGRRSERRHRLGIGATAAGRAGRRGVLPALHVAGLGHGTGRPRAGGSGGGDRRRRVRQRRPVSTRPPAGCVRCRSWR